MQKFTRALTREIEIDGVRLVITLDGEGLSIRPVGSRRPPLTLSWPAVVCACAAPPGANPEQIAAALATLRSSSKASAPAPGGGLGPWLDRLEAWLAKHRSRYHEGLTPGAAPDQIEALARALGRPIPDELRQWLAWHDGQDENLIGAFWEAFNLMSAAQIAAAWQDRAARTEPGWDRDWAPFLDDYQDNLLVLDLSQPGCPVREVWRGRSDHPVVAPTLAAWLEQFVRDVEAGRYVEDPERGEFHRI